GRPGNRQTLQADQGAGKVKTLHHLNKAFVFLAQAIALGNANVLEKDGTTANGSLAVTIETVAANTGDIHRHQQSRYAVRTRVAGARATEHDSDISLVGGGNGGFLAVNDVIITIRLNP